MRLSRRKPGHGWILEQAIQRQLNLEGRAYARDQLRGEQRVAARLEEVLLNTDAVAMQHLRPEPGQNFLGRVMRRDERVLRVVERGLPGAGSARWSTYRSASAATRRARRTLKGP